jgi:hypothetical protein
MSDSSLTLSQLMVPGFSWRNSEGPINQPDRSLGEMGMNLIASCLDTTHPNMLRPAHVVGG